MSLNNHYNYPDQLINKVNELAKDFQKGNDKDPDKELDGISLQCITQAVYDIWAEHLFQNWIATQDFQLVFKEESQLEQGITDVILRSKLNDLEQRGFVVFCDEHRKEVKLTEQGKVSAQLDLVAEAKDIKDESEN